MVQKRYIYWADDTDQMAQEIVKKYGDLMSANGILPTTNKNAAREEQPNVSGVIRFAMLVAAGKIKLPE